MPTKSKTKRGIRQDRARVAGNQPHEVARVARQSGKSAKTVRAAIKKHGHSRETLMVALQEVHEILNLVLPQKNRPKKRKRKMPMT